jgi:hypothetical protein
LMVLSVPFVGSKDIRTWVADNFPGVEINYGTGVCEHPRLHVERLLAEADCVKRMRGRPIVDFGGSPDRHNVFKRSNVWSTCPNTSGQDSLRIKKFKDLGLKNFCTHRAQECDHISQDAMMVHSVYYIPPWDIAKLFKKGLKNLYVVAHDFEDPSGRFHDEATYAKELRFCPRLEFARCPVKFSQEVVKMSVRGCNFEYSHPDASWLRNGSWFDPRVGTLVANRVKTFGCTHVYKVDFIKGYIQTETAARSIDRIWRDAVNSKDASKTVMIPGGTIVPAALLEKLYAVAYSEKDKKDLFRVLFVAGDQFMKTWKSSATVGSVSEIVLSSCAFVEKTYEQRRKMICDRQVSCWPSGCAVPLVACFARTAAKIHGNNQTSSMADWDEPEFKTPRFVTPGTPLVGVRKISDYAAQVPGFIGEIEGITQTPGTATTYDVIREGDTKFDKVSRIHFCGPTPIQDELPVVFNQDLDNVHRALQARAFAPVQPVDEDLFREFSSFVDDLLPRLFASRNGVFKPTPFHEWNKRFDQNKRDRHQAAWDRLHGSILTKEQCRKSKCFLKQEVTGPATEAKPPRLICGPTDELKVVLGPFLHALSKKVGQALKRDIVYAPGKNVIELGGFYDPTRESISTDMSRFDTCVTTKHMELMLKVYKFFNFPTDVQRAMKESIQADLSFRNGLFIVPHEPRRRSGHPNTTVENTLLNLFMHIFSIERCNHRKFTIMAGGDDIIIQGVPDLGFVALLTGLGFIPKPVVNAPGRGTFYSGFFLPVDGGRQVLTPFVGRYLSKFGATVVEQKDPRAWLRGCCQSALSVYQHVEPLRDCFQRLEKELGTGVVKEKIHYNYDAKDLVFKECDGTHAAYACFYEGSTFDELRAALVAMTIGGGRFDMPLLPRLLNSEA